MPSGLLRSDIFKLRKSKTLIGCCVAAVILGAAMALIFINAWNSIGNQIEQAVSMLKTAGMNDELIDTAFSTLPKPNRWSYANMLFSDGTIPLLFSIFISVFFASEYTMGTMKHSISRGFNRRDIYLSKLFTSFISIVAIGIAYFVGGMTVTLIFVRKGSELGTQEIIISIICYICLYISMAACYLLAAVAVKKTSSAIAICLAVPTLVSSLMTIIMYGNSDFRFVARFWIFNTPGYVQTMVTGGEWYLAIITAVVYFVAALITGILIFRRQEIK